MKEHPARGGVQEEACWSLLNSASRGRDSDQRPARLGRQSNFRDSEPEKGQELLDKLARC